MITIKMKKVHIAVIGAHIGDAEITAGHLVCKYVQAGHKATIISLTAGEKGNPKLSPETYKKQKVRETAASAKLWGCAVRVLNYKDGETEITKDAKLAVTDIIREIKPDIVLTHWKGSFHKDHRNTYYIVEEAVFYAALPGIKTKFPPWSVKQLYYTDNWEDPVGYTPNVFINIDEKAYNLWVKGCRKHALFRGEVASFDYLEYYKALTVVRGAKLRYKRAVAVMVPEFSNFRRYDFFPADETMEIF
ncbi:MAG: PIG-L family deacetylase [Elusimicrobiota bacterium]